MANFRKKSVLSSSENKKIKNAKETVIDGIVFRSETEGKCYLMLKSSCLDFSYESDTFTIIDSFKPKNLFVYESRKIRNKNKREFVIHKPSKPVDTTYTPDFTIKSKSGNIIVYVEFKGFANDIFPTKKKLFFMLLDRMMDENPSVSLRYAYIRNLKEMKELIDSLSEDPMFK